MLVRDLVTGSDGSPALIDAADGTVVTYGELRDLVSQRVANLGDVVGLPILLGASLDVQTVVEYLSWTSAGAAVAMLDPQATHDTVQLWSGSYCAAQISGFTNREDTTSSSDQNRASGTERVLLATSGSTGSPKFVRLSEQNVVANARQIAEALGITPEDRAMAHLPLFYSYGLSVLNSHLSAGACTVLCGASAITPTFWEVMSDHAVTSLPGVPYSYEMFRRAGLPDRHELPALRTMTQAGGRLEPSRIADWHAALAKHDVALHVMYGQTEATARMSVLPPSDLPEAIGSVGYAIPDGQFSIDEQDDEGTGEIVYTGPNVMLGYANDFADLNGSDQLQGRLSTGDLGRFDSSGRLWITGRLKRIGKVFGARINLDDIESRLSHLGQVAVVEHGEGVRVFLVADIEHGAPTARELERLLGLQPRSIAVESLDQLPVTTAGKIDYQELKSR